MDASFRRDAPVLQLADLRSASRRIFLLWPAWARRVIAPVAEDRGLDLFERALLGLCRSGVRRPDRIAELIHLNVDLCAHLLERATRAGYLDKHGELTSAGVEALRTGAPRTNQAWTVTYVFQDPFSGELWPRTVEQLAHAHVQRVRDGHAWIELGTADDPDTAKAQIVLPDSTMRPPAPAAAHVLAAIRADRAERSEHQVREFECRARLSAVPVPDDLAGHAAPAPRESRPEVRRVSFVADAEPVFLLAHVDVASSAGASGDGLTAADPFGVGVGGMLQSLVFGRMQRDDALQETVRERTAREYQRVADSYRRHDMEMRAKIEQKLVQELGAGIRGHSDALGHLVDIDLAAERSGRDEAIEKVRHATLRLYEVLLREACVAYPVTQDDLANIRGSEIMRKTWLVRAAQDMGFDGLHPLFRQASLKRIEDATKGSDVAFIQALVPAGLLAASTRHQDHPLRRMAPRRPDLLNAVGPLNKLRNDSAHAHRSTGIEQEIAWCRELAIEAAQELLLLPQSTPEGTRH